MKANNCSWRQLFAAGGLLTLLGATLALVTVAARESEASAFTFWRSRPGCHSDKCGVTWDDELNGESGGMWYWMRSPDQEKRVVMSLYSRYCVRCHGVDGRGIWDIPDVPDFTDPRWQASRSDGQLTRVVLEGRGACMPAFRGTLTLDETRGMARYLRTFVPGTEVSPPDVGKSEKPAAVPTLPVPKKLELPMK